MRRRAMLSANASRLGIAVLTLMSTTGCEIIAQVDRSQLDQGNGGAPPSTSSSSSSSSSSSGSMAECTEATVDADCPASTNECLKAACVEGKCDTTPVAQGTEVPTQVMGDCKLAVCDGNGQAVTQEQNSDTPNDGNDCTDDACVAGTPTYTNKTANTGCGAGGALFCDGNGACVGCTGDTQCGTPSDCAAPACTNGTCKTNFTAIGTPIPMQVAGDCQEIQCNGVGGTKVVTKASDVVDDNNSCTIDSCVGTTPMSTNSPSGSLCSNGGTGQKCNGAGVCVECLTGADCTSGVCSAQACAAPTCTDQVKNATETDVDCGGGGCSTCANGKMCNSNADCTSTICDATKVCVASICGDNKITGSETCDDGGTTSGNGCSATCMIEAGWECTGLPSVCTLSCGDNTLDAGEGCDDGGTMPGDGCSATCTVEAGYECSGVPSMCALSCGDSTIDTGEGCDDGNLNNGDGCSSACAVEPGYTCMGVPSMCTSGCGNNTIEGSEECDDGNVSDGDGCSSGCAVENGFTCTGVPSACSTTCGDGIVAGTETCDDTNMIDGDCCSATCSAETGCEIELNNTTGTANTYNAVFVSDVVKGFISPGSDVDYYEITIPAGMGGSITAETKDGPLGTTCASLVVDTNVAITDSTGTIIAQNDDIDTANYCSLVTAMDLPSGTYYLRVRNSPFVPTDTFDYSLQVTLTTAALSGACAGTTDCVAGATCVDTPTSYQCVCPAGLGGNGKTSGSGCFNGLYYAFDGSGTSVPNLATMPPAGAANATIVGAHTQGGAGKCGTALQGAGGAGDVNYVNSAWPTSFTGSWSVSFWLNGLTAGAPINYIFGDNTAGSLRCFAGGLAGANNIILRGLNMRDVIVNNAANGMPAMTTIVHDATTGDTRAYLNGVLTTTVTQIAALSYLGAGPFKVGGYSNASTSLPAGALLDEFRVYTRALSAAEVANLYNAPTCTP